MNTWILKSSKNNPKLTRPQSSVLIRSNRNNQMVSSFMLLIFDRPNLSSGKISRVKILQSTQLCWTRINLLLPATSHQINSKNLNRKNLRTILHHHSLQKGANCKISCFRWLPFSRGQSCWGLSFKRLFQTAISNLNSTWRSKKKWRSSSEPILTTGMFQPLNRFKVMDCRCQLNSESMRYF